MAFMEWETPQDFFNEINREFMFERDLAANSENTKCLLYYDEIVDSLKLDWKGICWLNPPYDRNIGLWIQKAYESAQQGALVVCLIQGRSSDTIWWHNYVMRASEIRYIKDRLHFGRNGKFSRANISNIIVVFRPYCKGPPKTSSIDTKGKPIK